MIRYEEKKKKKIIRIMPKGYYSDIELGFFSDNNDDNNKKKKKKKKNIKFLFSQSVQSPRSSRHRDQS